MSLKIIPEKTLRGLLALGLIVLVDGVVSPATLEGLSEFTTVDAAEIASTAEIATRLLRPGKDIQ